ncbi:MAG: superoxide dismutase [Chloroflexota bacterium]
MKIIAISHDVEGLAQPDFSLHLKAESLRVWELMQAGILREIHFREDGQGAVLTLECASAEAAREYVDSLPLVKAGLIAFEVIALVPYGGLSRLFAHS